MLFGQVNQWIHANSLLAVGWANSTAGYKTSTFISQYCYCAVNFSPVGHRAPHFRRTLALHRPAPPPVAPQGV
ncbi:hypothetical protein [Kamptonema formosum]|uniref:hypothetical protein n=1 Tax=Kamptonema formosum TaxID=331992 RepID=UPI00034BBE00|nr:hypothetical protein [Oscillatoria sp. PCC 10802]